MRFILSILLGCFTFVALAQKENINWVFGYGCGLTFEDVTFAFSANSHSFDVTSVVSNSDGELVVYYSQNQVRNFFGNIIPNGDSILCFDGSYSQTILLRFSENKIILLTNGLYERGTCPYFLCSNLTVSEIEKNAGVWFIKNKNRRVNTSPIDSRFALIRHANGIDWWLITHEMQKGQGFQFTNSFYRFLLSADTITGPFIQNIGYVHNRPELYFGDVAVARSGDKIALSLTEIGLIEHYDFDRCTGELSNLKTIQGSSVNRYACLEFSPSEQFLYVSTGRGYDENALYQLDLSQPNIQASAVRLWHHPKKDTVWAGALKLAPDGNIYMTCRISDTSFANPWSNKLSVIHSPDSSGTACDFRPFDFELTSNCRTSHGLPHIPNYSLGALPVYLADAGIDTFYCAGDSTIKGVRIGGDTIQGVTYQWQPGFGIDSLNAPSHLVRPPQSQWYYVTITDTTYSGPSCASRLDSVYVEVRTCVGISEVGDLKAKVYPNPATNTLTIELPGGGEGRLTLYNLLGQEVFGTATHGRQTTVGLSLPPGVYLYRITQGTQHANGKLLVE